MVESNYILDSLGEKNEQRIQKTLLRPLKKIGLIAKNEPCEVLNTFLQTEGECGIRTMEYMMRFKQWATRSMEANEITVQLIRIISCERQDRQNLARNYRHKIHRALQEEKRLLSE